MKFRKRSKWVVRAAGAAATSTFGLTLLLAVTAGGCSQ